MYVALICSHGTCGSDDLHAVTLHLSGSERYWSIDEELSAIFLHPTLRGLTISCAELHQDALRWLQGTVRTPLRKLELIECNLTVEALDTLLSLPRALEELTTGEPALTTSPRNPSNEH